MVVEYLLLYCTIITTKTIYIMKKLKQFLKNAVQQSNEENQQLKNAVQLGSYLYNLSLMNDELTSTEALKLQFVDITKNVQSAVEVFRICADFMPQTKDKHFVVMTANLIRLYLFYFSKCYPTGENMPQPAKDALRSLVERLEELNYEQLRNQFEL